MDFQSGQPYIVAALITIVTVYFIIKWHLSSKYQPMYPPGPRGYPLVGCIYMIKLMSIVIFQDLIFNV